MCEDQERREVVVGVLRLEEREERGHLVSEA
jgi:hypothetical protein